jgi:hypothetical protein
MKWSVDFTTGAPHQRPTNQCLDNDKSAVSSDPTGSAVNCRFQALPLIEQEGSSLAGVSLRLGNFSLIDSITALQYFHRTIYY